MLSTMMKNMGLDEPTEEAMKPIDLSSLGPDILLMVLEQLPDMESLWNATLSCKALYGAFKAHQDIAATAVLKNEVPEDCHDLMMVCQRASEGRYGGMDLSRIDFRPSYPAINAWFDGAVADRQRAASALFTPKKAIQASRLYRLFSSFAGSYIVNPTDNAADWPGKATVSGHSALANHGFSLQGILGPSPGTSPDVLGPQVMRSQVIRALYLWRIVVAISNALVFAPHRNNAAGGNKPTAHFMGIRFCARQRKLLYVQRQLCQKLITRFELLQAATVHHCLRTELHRRLLSLSSPQPLPEDTSQDLTADILLLGVQGGFYFGPYLGSEEFVGEVLAAGHGLMRHLLKDGHWSQDQALFQRAQQTYRLSGTDGRIRVQFLDVVFPEHKSIYPQDFSNTNDVESSSELPWTTIKMAHGIAWNLGATNIDYPEFDAFLSECIGNYIIRHNMAFWSPEVCQEFSPWAEWEMRGVVKAAAISHLEGEQDDERREVLHEVSQRMG